MFIAAHQGVIEILMSLAKLNNFEQCVTNGGNTAILPACALRAYLLSAQL